MNCFVTSVWHRGGGGVVAPSSGTGGRQCGRGVLWYRGRQCGRGVLWSRGGGGVAHGLQAIVHFQTMLVNHGPWFTSHPTMAGMASWLTSHAPHAQRHDPNPILEYAKMPRCPELSVDILWPVRCQDVKMSRLMGGHRMAQEMSRGFWAVIVRCQDAKMSGQGCAGREMSRGFCDVVVKCQYVKMSRCQDVRNVVGGS